MRLFTDARRTEEAIGLGFVFDTDDYRDTGAQYIEGDYTSMEAEFHALLEGVRRSMEYDDKTIFCYVDCRPLVDQLERPTNDKWHRCKKQLHDLLDKFEFWKISWIPREKNSEADYLSNRCMRSL